MVFAEIVVVAVACVHTGMMERYNIEEYIIALKSEMLSTMYRTYHTHVIYLGYHV